MKGSTSVREKWPDVSKLVGSPVHGGKQDCFRVDVMKEPDGRLSRSGLLLRPHNS